jgi:predicted AAA+ superfamily ATPase
MAIMIDTREILARPRYEERIRPFIGTPLVKVVTGQRRVGKSRFLRSLRGTLADANPGTPILFVDKEAAEWDRVADASDLLLEVDRVAPSGRCILMVDEAQEIRDFERAIRSLAGEGRFDIYLTGSNAHLLSGEIATLFAGRAVAVQVHPLTYDEFLAFQGLPDADESLVAYLRYGGLPFLRHLPLRDDTAIEYLRGVLDTAVLKDVVQRHGLRSPDLLDRLLHFVADSVGSPCSAQSISRFLKSQATRVSVPTVLEYLAHLRQAFVVNCTRRADLAGKRILEVGEKYWFEDLGLRAAVRGFRDEDAGKVVENAVYLRLLADGWDVDHGAIGDREIDFVCDRGGERLYVQAAYVLADAATRDREFGNLLAVRDNHPKAVVSMDPLVSDREGVRHIRVRDFLRDGFRG